MGIARKIISRFFTRVLAPVCPLSLRLPLNFWADTFERTIEPELQYLYRYISPRGNAIDIGANVGTYAYVLAKKFKHVFAFEPNLDLTFSLRNFDQTRVSIFHVGLSSKAERRTFFIPENKGAPLSGWGSFSPVAAMKNLKFRERIVETKTLDSYGFPNVSFVKIDVEGHEMEVLKGAVETFRKNMPVLLLEIEGQNLAAVCCLLWDLGYQKFSLKEVIGIKGSPQNFIFFPKGHP